MKTLLLALLTLGFTASAWATDKMELDNEIRTLTGKLVSLQSKPAKAIRPQLLNKARGIVLLNRTKAGFIFAYQGGGGVVMVKDDQSNKWSAPAFVKANEASLGFQVGGQQSFVVILLMTTNAVQAVIDSKFDFGGEASGTAGNASGGVDGTVSSADVPVLVFADREGLYGGAAIKGNAVTPSVSDNFIYYEASVTMREILLDKKVKAPEAAQALANQLVEYSKEPKK